MAKKIIGWDGTQIGIVPSQGENPMLVFGYGPDGATCKSCAHLIRDDWHNKTYLKCNLRKHTRGAGSDHRASWPACKKYEAKTTTKTIREGK